MLIACITEFQRRPVLGHVEERRSFQAARLLSGNSPRASIKSPLSHHHFPQAGIGTYTGSSVIGTPIIQATSKLLDQMVAWNLPSHIKGYSSLPRLPCSIS